MEEKSFEWGEDVFTIYPWPEDGMRFHDRDGQTRIFPRIGKGKVLKDLGGVVYVVLEDQVHCQEFFRDRVFRTARAAQSAALSPLERLMADAQIFWDTIKSLSEDDPEEEP